MNYNKYIDHTLLKPDCTDEQIEKLCKEAKEFMDKNLSYDMTNYVYINEIKEI